MRSGEIAVVGWCGKIERSSFTPPFTRDMNGQSHRLTQRVHRHSFSLQDCRWLSGLLKMSLLMRNLPQLQGRVADTFFHCTFPQIRRRSHLAKSHNWIIPVTM